MKFFKLLTLVLIATSLSACAQRWREADTGLSTSEVGQMFSETQTVNHASSQQTQAATQMVSAQGSILYFAAAPIMAPIHIITPLDFFSLGFNVGYAQLAEVRVFFVDNPNYANGGRRENTLTLHLKDFQGQSYVQTFSNLSNSNLPMAQISDYDFVVALQGESTTIILRSDDIIEGDLADNIQFKVYVVDNMGNENFVGQISTLAGHF